MIYLAVGIAGVVLAVGLALWANALNRKRILRKVEAGVDMVKASLCRRLTAEYWRNQDQDFAAYLAAAVVNEVFSEDPRNDGERSFVEENRALIEAERRRLLTDPQLHHVVTKTLLARVTASMLFARGELTAKAARWLGRLKEYHATAAEGAFPGFRYFIRLAAEFEAAERTTVHLGQ